MTTTSDQQARWAPLQRILSRQSKFGNETGKLPCGEYDPSTDLLSTLHHTNVLVIGAGGLGCEILKDLALSGVMSMHVIDLDTIDVSNLNRQFLFRACDVGRGKAETAAEFIMKRVPGCTVIPHKGKIQDFDETFYRQFKLIVSGLDNIEARRWLNSTLVGMVQYDDDGEPDPESMIPLIDGGTEGLKGQARVIIPMITSCFECSLDSFPPPQGFPMCTIAENPRVPEHCIAYAFIVEWEKHFPEKTLNKDSPEDMQWVYERALERAERFKIEGVTYFKTMGVVKNIIPAVASTNAVISAACVTEALKLLTFCGQSLNTYFMYMGSQGLYSPTFDYGRKDTCIVCASATKQMSIPSSTTLQAFLQLLCDDVSLQLKHPSVTGESTSLYMQKPPSLEAALRKNLERSMGDLVQNGEVLTVTDPMLRDVSLAINLQLIAD